MDRFPPASTRETPGASPAPPFIRTHLNSSRPGPLRGRGPLSPSTHRAPTGTGSLPEPRADPGGVRPPLFETLTDSVSRGMGRHGPPSMNPQCPFFRKSQGHGGAFSEAADDVQGATVHFRERFRQIKAESRPFVVPGMDIPGLPEGLQDLTASAAGCTLQTVSVEVFADNTVKLNFALEGCPG